MPSFVCCRAYTKEDRQKMEEPLLGGLSALPQIVTVIPLSSE